MKKIGFKPAKLGSMFLIAVMAFAAIGAGYAHWQETIYITGVMTTDDINPIFANYVSNDDPGSEFEQQLDPTGCGEWFYDEDDDAWSWSEDGRRDKNVGTTDITTSNNDQTLNINIEDAYPCYYSHVAYMIRNTGSCPVLIHEPLVLKELSIQLKPNKPGTYQSIPIKNKKLNIGTTYYVDIYLHEESQTWKARIVEGPVNNEAKFDFSIMLTGSENVHLINYQLDPWSWRDNPGIHIENPDENYNDQIPGDLCIHFENGCMQNVVYDFKFGMTFWNWPEFTPVIPPPPTTVTWPEDGTGYIGYEDRAGGDFDYNDFGMNMFIQETHEEDTGKVLEIYMEFEAVSHLAGDKHDIHIERSLAAPHDYDYTITRTRAAQGTEKAAGTYSSGGYLDVILFDTQYVQPGDIVTIHLVSTEDPQFYGPGIPPRWDLDGIWDFYDPWMYDRTISAERHIGDWQAAASPLPTTGYDVPYILIVPYTDWPAPNEAQVITTPYPDFDNYYSTQSATYEDWYIPTP